MRWLPVSSLSLLLVALVACTSPATGADAGGGGGGSGDGGQVNDPGAGGDCGDADPLTNDGWVGFCGDRVDDNCAVDQPNDTCPTSTASHNYCNTGDEPCPTTQPGSAAPTWDCTGTPPAGVIAYARYDDAANLNVTAFCAFVYESSAVPGEHYVAVSVTNGANVRAAKPGDPTRDCSADTSARRHLYFSNLDEGACPDVKYIHAYAHPSPGQVTSADYPSGYPTDEQKLSNGCRKMIRNITYNDPAFEPDLQYFAASRQEALAKLSLLETAEVNCIGIDNLNHEPYRATEQFYVQASAPITVVGAN